MCVCVKSANVENIRGRLLLCILELFLRGFLILVHVRELLRVRFAACSCFAMRTGGNAIMASFLGDEV